jgi:YidC/Oxa1 family membrane protein insertase
LDFMVLTKSGGSILGPIADVFGYVMNFLFLMTSKIGILNIGLCIILFTIVTRLLLLPLTIKQQKTSKLMNVMQPELNAIQKKYKGKDDQQSMMMMQSETKAVYEKYGTSMMGGCLPLLIQMPILFALYRVIYNIPGYVSSVKSYFELIVNALPAGFQSNATFQALAETHNMVGDKFDFSQVNTVIDLLYKLTDKQWGELTASSAFPNLLEITTQNGENVVNAIHRMQNFCSVNIAYTPFTIIMDFFNGLKSGNSGSVLVVVAALSIPILAGLTQWFSSKLMMASQPKQDPDAPGAGMMNQMNVMMPLMSVFFCFTFASGIGIYWIAQSAIMIVQQYILNGYFNKVDIDILIEKNLEKANKKRAKRGLPPERMNRSASETLKLMQEKENREEEKRMEKMAKTKAIVKDSTEYYNKDAKPGSLASKAAMVQKYNERNSKK